MKAYLAEICPKDEFETIVLFATEDEAEKRAKMESKELFPAMTAPTQKRVAAALSRAPAIGQLALRTGFKRRWREHTSQDPVDR